MALTRDKRNLLFMVGALLAIMALFQFVSYGVMFNTHDLTQHKSTRREERFGGVVVEATTRIRPEDFVGQISSVVRKELPFSCRAGLCTFLDITINSTAVGRIVFLLHGKQGYQRSKAVENFRALSTGEIGFSSSGTKLHYKGTKFNRIVHNILVQGGDINGGKATEDEKESVYGMAFEHESLDQFHERGLLAMAGLKKCGSEFFITLDSVAELDNQYAVFGKVVEGMDVVEQINAVKVNGDGDLTVPVVISNSGQL